MNRRLIPIFLVVLVDVLGLMMIVPMLPLYAEGMGATPFIASLLFTSYAACQLIAGPILGQISDRVGRKPVLLVSQIGTLIGFGILAMANSLPLVFLSRVLDGLTAGNLSVAHAYIADESEPKDRARSFGFIGIAFGFGFLVGPALAGILVTYGARWPVYGAMMASAASIITTAWLLPSSKLEKIESSSGELSSLNPAAFKIAFRDRGLTIRLGQFILFSLAFSSFFAGFPLFAERHYQIAGHFFGVHEIGLTLGLMGLIAIPTQMFLLGALVKGVGERVLIAGGFIGVAIGFALLAVASPLVILALAVTLLGMASSLLRPSLISLITQYASKQEQGMIMGLVQSLISVCQIISPMYGGALIQQGHLKSWAFVAATLTFSGFLLGRWTKADTP